MENKALEYSLKLLSYRMYSEKILTEKLQAKKYEMADIETALETLRRNRLVDDKMMAKLLVESRARIGRGQRRIYFELIKKGLPKADIEEALSQIDKTSELETAQAVAQKRYDKLRDLPPEKSKARLFGYLSRRGYSPDIVMNVVNRLTKGYDE